MPKIFQTLDKIRPLYDWTYKIVMFICKLLLVADILITTMSVCGRYISFIPDPAWSEEVVLTLMSYMAVLSLGHLRYQLLHHHIHHGTRSKAQQIRKYGHYICRSKYGQEGRYGLNYA